ncbi:MAG: hypothetical protein LUE63_10640 [Lachnospiraceae bacterium]|nr:hypothetical protein [Lachnospiraceae bacterium]
MRTICERSASMQAYVGKENDEKDKKVSSSVKQTVISTAATGTYSAQLAGTEDEYGSVTPQSCW